MSNAQARANDLLQIAGTALASAASAGLTKAIDIASKVDVDLSRVGVLAAATVGIGLVVS